MSRPDIIAEVCAEYRARYHIRFALFAVFKSFADAGRMTSLYGQRTVEQIKAALEYEGNT